VFSDLDLLVRRGEKIALIGPNGAGKTTLLRIIAGELEASAGSVRIGSGVSIGYYAQHHADTLHRESSAYSEVLAVSPETSPGRVRSILGAFLFSGDDVDKSVAVLSGGERARLALARLLIKPGNLLLMDEPTNHLDLWSSESLADSLSAYDGTLVFVSHNRALIRKLATRIWNVENGTVETYPGTLDEYMYSKRLRGEDGGVMSDAPTSSDAGDGLAPRRSRKEEQERKRREAEARRQRSRVVGPLEKKVKELELRITSLENAQAVRSEALSDPAVYDDKDQRNDLLDAFQKAAAELDQLTARWETAQEQLEVALSELDRQE
jgi:ATP-binding cassette subfamily F protein 3